MTRQPSQLIALAALIVVSTGGDVLRAEQQISKLGDAKGSAGLAQSGHNRGSASGSVGPQWPGLLSRYARRPAWAVAGVDYPVGLRTRAMLKMPEAIAIPGVVVDRGSHRISITRNNSILEGYDFSEDGGWSIELAEGVNGSTIQNNYFRVGTNNLSPIEARHGGQITIRLNTFDGGGQSSTVTAMIDCGSGAIIENNHFTNFPNDAINVTLSPAEISNTFAVAPGPPR